MNWRRLRTLLVREFRATFRDPFTVTILVAVPLVAELLFSFVLSTRVEGLALGVHDQSASGASRRLIAELAINGSFAPRRYETVDALEHALLTSEVGVGIVIPPDFDRGLRQAAAGTGPPPEIRAIYDGGESVLAGNAEAYLRSQLSATIGELTAAERQRGPAGAARNPARRGGIETVTRVLFNPSLDGTPFMVAGVFGFVLSFLTTLITAVSIVNERVVGTFEQLQVTPATGLEIFLGKILPLGAAFAFDVTLMALVAGFLLGVWPAGSMAFFLIVSWFYVLISLALGLMISATSATAAEAVQKTVLLSIPVIQLSGFAVPIRNMPTPVRWFTELLPATHYIRVSRGIYLRAATAFDLWPELLVLTIFGVILVALSLRSIEARA